jgi:predicted LPLAT superfamily acyltransferase
MDSIHNTEINIKKQLFLLILTICSAYHASAMNQSQSKTESKIRTDAASHARRLIMALVIAAKNGHLAQVQTLIARGAQVSAYIRTGDTALLSAARNGHLKVVKTLIAAGADIDAVRINQLPNRVAVWEAIEEGLKERKLSLEF